MTGTAADGHVEVLKMPVYAPGAPAPVDLLELGDTTDAPASSLWPENPKVRLYLRSTQGGGGF